MIFFFKFLEKIPNVELSNNQQEESDMGHLLIETPERFGTYNDMVCF